MKKKPLTNKIGEVRELTRNDIRDMRTASEALPANLLKVLPKRRVGERGQQKKPTKMLVALRYSPEVVKFFKNTGKGWQVRMDNALKEWIKDHPPAANHDHNRRISL
jgi:uncharacterized protein (DUF4415 family)